MSGLSITREQGETWREAAARYGRRYGLEHEVLECFDEDVAMGTPEDTAAWGACREWDVLDLAPSARASGIPVEGGGGDVG